MTKDTKLSELVINKLTTAQYAGIEEKDPNQLYIVTDAPGFEESRTNCITEIPQDIELELNNGTLTLKAGSKVYVPNGFESDGTTPKFDVVTVESDTIVPCGNSGTRFCFFGRGLNCVDSAVGLLASGNTAPTSTSNIRWYDTKSNLMKTYENGAWVASNIYSSLPFAVCSADTNKLFTSIDQVFNGFGYIGSTVFALPGVKCLIPNGRNENGTLKNIEFINTSVRTETRTSGTGSYVSVLGSTAFSSGLKTRCEYDETSNRLVWYDNFSATTQVFDFDLTDGVITSFKPKTTFQALDYNDKSTVSGWGMPSNRYIDLTLGASGSSYTAPANGWVMLSKQSTATTQYVELGISNSIRMRGTPVVASSACMAYIPVKKGGGFYLSYTTDGTTNFFRFIYAEGEV